MNRTKAFPAQQAFLLSFALLVTVVVLFWLPTCSGFADSAAQEPPAYAGEFASSASEDGGTTDGDSVAWLNDHGATEPCLTIAILVYPLEPVPATWDIHYSLVVRNGCSLDCTSVVVTDTKDSRTYYRDSAPLYDDRTGEDTFIWHLGDLAAGQQQTVLLEVVTGPSLANQTVRNEATVDSDQTQPLTVVRETQMGPMPPAATPTLSPTPTHTATPTPSPTATPTATPEVVPVVELRLDPPSSTVTEGELFDLAIRVDAGSQPVDGAEVHLDFDPVYLQVVDANGDPASDIENSGVLSTLILNQASNTTGQIDFATGILQGELPSGTFLLATLHLRALNDTGSDTTSLTFVTQAPRQTNVTHGGNSVLAQVHNAAVRISAVTQPCLTIAKLAFPVEPVPATWDIHYSLLVRNGCSFECTNVVVSDTKDSRTYYRDSAPLYDDRTGEDTFIWHLGDLAPGQQQTVLLEVVTGPSLANQTVRNEATVDSDQTAPLTVVRETQMGPVLPTATPIPTSTPTPSPTPTPTATPEVVPVVELRLDPPSPAVTEGELFDLAIRVDAASQLVDGAEVHLDFDPVYLQVVDANGDPASEIEDGGVLNTVILNQASNMMGRIDFAAGILQGELPSGTFLLATLHLRALNNTGAGATSMTFVTELPRQTNVTHRGGSVLAQVHNAAVRVSAITPTPTVPVFHLFLPIIMR
jgi:hypothetical protein